MIPSMAQVHGGSWCRRDLHRRPAPCLRRSGGNQAMIRTLIVDDDYRVAARLHRDHAARDVASVRAAMRLGAAHYLVKPFGFAKLRNKLVTYLDLQRKLARIGEATHEDVDAHPA